MTAGTFTIIKNEILWIAEHLNSWLPHVDEMVFFDGNSTDGTLEVIKDFRSRHPFGKRIKLYEDKDPKDLRDDYIRVFNECLHSLGTDYAIFAHPDMILEDPGNIAFLGDAHAYFSTMRSFAGEPGGQVCEIKTGRFDRWKNIHRLRKPDLGLHYHGHYGAWNEDLYFSKITGNVHDRPTKRLPPTEGNKYAAHPCDLEAYPYAIKDSGIKISHYSDVRPLSRRIDRMIKCLGNMGFNKEECASIAAKHPRVTLESVNGFSFEPIPTPEFLKEIECPV